MAFDTAVSGINSATADLGVIGNNIANSSTTGFKTSRAEFADLYATSLLGAGGNAIGKGVSLTSVTQEFTQGNISFTNNALDPIAKIPEYKACAVKVEKIKEA